MKHRRSSSKWKLPSPLCTRHGCWRSICKAWIPEQWSYTERPFMMTSTRNWFWCIYNWSMSKETTRTHYSPMTLTHSMSYSRSQNQAKKPFMSRHCTNVWLRKSFYMRLNRATSGIWGTWSDSPRSSWTTVSISGGSRKRHRMPWTQKMENSQELATVSDHPACLKMTKTTRSETTLSILLLKETWEQAATWKRQQGPRMPIGMSWAKKIATDSIPTRILTVSTPEVSTCIYRRTKTA